MKAFFKGFGIIIGLFFVGSISLAVSSQLGMVVAAALVLVPLVALLRPIPSIGFKHRGFSAAVLFLVGVPISLAIVGTNAETAKLLELRKSDPAAYLAAIRATDKTKWLAELALIDPDRHRLELAKVAAEEEQRMATLQAAEDDRLLELEAAEQRLKAEETARKSAAIKSEIDQYIEQLNREITSLPAVSVSKYQDTVTDINFGLLLIGSWNLLYEEGAKLQLSPDDEKKRQHFRDLLIKKQAEMLPALRDAYGPAMRRQLWEADGSARTVGVGYRTVEFVSAAFARNANIKQIHTEMYENLLMLRFTRAQYKWFDRASDYSFYTLEPPKDTDLVRWESGGKFRVLN